MCHWTKNPIHFEWLMPVVDDPSESDKKNAYKGRGGTSNEDLHPFRVTDSCANILEKELGIGGKKLPNKKAGDNDVHKEKSNTTTPAPTIPPTITNMDNRKEAQVGSSGPGKEKLEEPSIDEAKVSCWAWGGRSFRIRMLVTKRIL